MRRFADIRDRAAERKVQAAFNTWQEESGESCTRIGRIVAMSVEG